MIVSTSNIASTATITATPDSSLQDISVITDGDYSTAFTDALAGEVVIKFSFDKAVDIGYIALGGTNIGSKTSFVAKASVSAEPVYILTSDGEFVTTSDGLYITEAQTYEDSVIDDISLGLSDSPVMMYQVDFVGVKEVEFTITGTGQISISEIAMGSYYEIPRGEQSGYKRAWTVPNIASRSSSTLSNTPINLSYESRSLSCSISVPNNIMADFESGWYDFIDYAASNTFYILEDDDKFHSYAAFNAVPSMTAAHSKTRALGVSSISFNAFAKSTGVLF